MGYEVYGISSRFKNDCFAVMRSRFEEGSYLRLVDVCITQLQAESNKEEEEDQIDDQHHPCARVKGLGFEVFQRFKRMIWYLKITCTVQWRGSSLLTNCLSKSISSS